MADGLFNLSRRDVLSRRAANDTKRGDQEPAATGSGSVTRSGFGDIDPTAAGRAAAASAAVFARYEGLIAEVSRNLGLSQHERAAAIVSLRQRQSAEAAAASKAVMDEAKGGAKRRRQMQRKGRHQRPR